MPDLPPLTVRKVAEATLPTEFGQFRIHAFEGTAGNRREEAVAVVMGDVSTPDPVLVRIHSQCLTGDVFHSLRCDCRAQLELSLQTVAAAGRGLVIYEKKEGRGIGLLNKIRAYQLQDAGADTIEANEQLGFESDLRGYELPAGILRHFGIHQVRLLTNNPDKIAALEANDVLVVERVPCQVIENGENAGYLRTKKVRMGHLLEL